MNSGIELTQAVAQNIKQKIHWPEKCAHCYLQPLRKRRSECSQLFVTLRISWSCFKRMLLMRKSSKTPFWTKSGNRTSYGLIINPTRYLNPKFIKSGKYKVLMNYFLELKGLILRDYSGGYQHILQAKFNKNKLFCNVILKYFLYCSNSNSLWIFSLPRCW